MANDDDVVTSSCVVVLFSALILALSALYGPGPSQAAFIFCIILCFITEEIAKILHSFHLWARKVVQDTTGDQHSHWAVTVRLVCSYLSSASILLLIHSFL